MERIARVFESYAPSENEAQTEEGLAKPVLRVLEHDFEAQPALATPDAPSAPTTSSTATRLCTKSRGWTLEVVGCL